MQNSAFPLFPTDATSARLIRMKSTEIREKFLKFFEKHGHTRVKSSSLIPAADPTLLFTNAGMVQFKDCFLGLQNNGYTRATTSQKCVRAGGKHNDLENVGFTPRHHTFFEMLGNFSFGDYFKKEAISLAWELLTKELKIPKEKLRITVFQDDDEAMELWKAEGIRPDWIYRLGEKDNFWAMGDTGPCGPCTEIHYDWGESLGCGKPDCSPACPCGSGRFLEIWNLVFMQYNRDSSGKMTPLPKPSVDTGAGLERVSAVLNGVFSNYDTDLFLPLIHAIAKKAGKTYGANKDEDVSMRVIADHLRSGTFLISDGVIPSNEGRGYVLRRILRRAIRHGKKLGQQAPFIYTLVENVGEVLGSVYPEIIQNRKMIEVLLREEEEKFHETIHRGIGLLDESIAKSKAQKSSTLSGDVAFKLYDTFGFPFDLVEVICREHAMGVDEKAFSDLMDKQRAQSNWKGGDSDKYVEKITKVLEGKKISPTFEGYSTLECDGNLNLLFDMNGTEVRSLSSGTEGFAIFDKTPFYAESGGQVGDKGTIHQDGAKALVGNTFKVAKTIVHQLKVTDGQLQPAKRAKLSVDKQSRKLTAINHTATHMMHAALRKVLGDRVKQAGSLVDSSRLRFDFTYPRGVTADEIKQIETLVNKEIQSSDEVVTKEMKYDDAIKSGALAFFDEKYGDSVRVVRVGGTDSPFSVELCGGTHLTRTSDIGLFKILSETSVASGTRRIEAVTSLTAFEYLTHRNELLASIEAKVGMKEEKAVEKLEQLSQQLKQLQKENESLKVKVAQGGSGSKSDASHETFGAYKAFIQIIPSADAKVLRTLSDQFRDKGKDKTFVVLASEMEGKVSLCVGLTKDLVGTFDAGKIVKELAGEIKGTGGGRPDFAQAGGSDASGIQRAFDKFRSLLKDK